MHWDLAEKRNDLSTVEGKMFLGLQKLEQIRKEEKAFVSYADTWTVETWEKGVLCIGRFYDGEKIYGLFNSVSTTRRHGSMKMTVCMSI